MILASLWDSAEIKSICDCKRAAHDGERNLAAEDAERDLLKRNGKLQNLLNFLTVKCNYIFKSNFRFVLVSQNAY